MSKVNYYKLVDERGRTYHFVRHPSDEAAFGEAEEILGNRAEVEEKPLAEVYFDVYRATAEGAVRDFIRRVVASSGGASRGVLGDGGAWLPDDGTPLGRAGGVAQGSPPGRVPTQLEVS